MKALFGRKQKETKPVRKRNFWTQGVHIEGRWPRKEFFSKLSEGKKVLHLGCTDWPVFHPETNLHIYLAQYAAHLHGMDIDAEGIARLKEYVDQPYYLSLDNTELLSNGYDVCIVPETIEHVDNPADFLKKVGNLPSNVFYITGPNAFCKKHIERNYYEETEFVEVVHPDHNCWFSPYTLKNCIEKYSGLKVTAVYLLEDETQVCCEARKL